MEQYLTTPWARVRYDVVAHVIDQTIESQCLGRSMHVLDLGGGDGMDSISLAEAGHEVTLVDDAPGMLDRARARPATDGAGARLRAVRADLRDWTPDQSYDLVLCHFVLQYLVEDGAVLDLLTEATRGRMRVAGLPEPGRGRCWRRSTATVTSTWRDGACAGSRYVA